MSSETLKKAREIAESVKNGAKEFKVRVSSKKSSNRAVDAVESSKGGRTKKRQREPEKTSERPDADVKRSLKASGIVLKGPEQTGDGSGRSVAMDTQLSKEKERLLGKEEGAERTSLENVGGKAVVETPLEQLIFGTGEGGSKLDSDLSILPVNEISAAGDSLKVCFEKPIIGSSLFSDPILNPVVMAAIEKKVKKTLEPIPLQLKRVLRINETGVQNADFRSALSVEVPPVIGSDIKEMLAGCADVIIARMTGLKEAALALSQQSTSQEVLLKEITWRNETVEGELKKMTEEVSLIRAEKVKMAADLETAQKDVEALREGEKELVHLRAEKTRMEAELERIKKEMEDLRTAKEQADGKVVHLGEEVVKLEKKVEDAGESLRKINEELAETKVVAANVFVDSFTNALDQVEVLHPHLELDLSLACPSREVVGKRLIERRGEDIVEIFAVQELSSGGSSLSGQKKEKEEGGQEFVVDSNVKREIKTEAVDGTSTGGKVEDATGGGGDDDDKTLTVLFTSKDL